MHAVHPTIDQRFLTGFLENVSNIFDILMINYTVRGASPCVEMTSISFKWVPKKVLLKDDVAGGVFLVLDYHLNDLIHRFTLSLLLQYYYYDEDNKISDASKLKNNRAQIFWHE